jgi:hypothetical protein
MRNKPRLHKRDHLPVSTAVPAPKVGTVGTAATEVPAALVVPAALEAA